MATPDGWTSLGCSVFRCCCCPGTVYYPPNMSVNISNPIFNLDPITGKPVSVRTTGTAGFNISCVWLDCPRGSENANDTFCQPDFDPAPAGPCWDGANCLALVERCHPCSYALIGEDGTPGIKPVGGSYAAGGGIPILVPNPTDPIGGDPYTGYVIGFNLFCNCYGGSGPAPAVLTYVEPDSGTPCGWMGDFTIVSDSGDPLGPSNILNSVSSFEDFPNPPIRMTNPMDPYRFSCCDPFFLRFLLVQYEPTWYAGNFNGSRWPDPTEPPPFNPCCNAPFCTPDETIDGSTYACQENYLPDKAFGFIDVTGGASCFLPRDYVTNCLDGFKDDGC